MARRPPRHSGRHRQWRKPGGVREWHTRGGKEEHLIVVQADDDLVCGVMLSGVLHRGARGRAGDIGHVKVPSAGNNVCRCGNLGCLDTVASGISVMRQLREMGVHEINDLVALADNVHPAAIGAIRSAGEHLGGVLVTLLNFINPQAVLLTGNLTHVRGYLAAFRASLYQHALPSVTSRLEIAPAKPGACLLGGGLAARQAVIHSVDIDQGIANTAISP